jgi:DNA (cytosine-5)-methyltransferase 1
MVNGRGVPYVLVPSPPIKPSGGLIPYVLVPSRTPKPSGRATPYVLVPSIPQKRKASPTPGSASPDPSPKKRREEANLPDSAGSSSGNNIEYTEDELEDDAPLDSRDGIPVRTLSGFCIFEGQDLVSTTELLGGIFGRSFTASGLVRDHHLGSTIDDDDEDDCGLFVKGLQITELDLHHVSKEGIVDKYSFLFLRRIDADKLPSDVYIKTERAWYILNTPADIYRPFFIPLWIRHQFTRLIVASALNNPITTYAEFVDSLPKPLTETELKSVEVVSCFNVNVSMLSSSLL